MFNDLIFSFRLLRKNLSFSITSLIVITLGLTVSLCVFTILYEFRKAPPFPDGERFAVVKVFDQVSGSELNMPDLTGYAFHTLNSQASNFEQFGMLSYGSSSLVVEDEMRPLSRVSVTPNLMTMTQIVPVLGRNFVAEDGIPEATPVTAISYQLWQSLFLESPAVIGQEVRIDNIPHTVVGVMPEDFYYPLAQDIWVPLQVPESGPLPEGAIYWLAGKLKPEVTLESATLELNNAFAVLREEFPQEYGNLDLAVVGFNTIKSQGTGGTGTLFNAVAAIIFLLASLNLSAILFARANERRAELAVRNALGATVWQLRNQVLLESALLCVLGCVLAIGLSILILQWVRLMLAAVMSSLGSYVNFDFTIDSTSLIYVALATGLIWLASSAATIFRVGNENLFQTMESGSQSESTKSRGSASKIIIGLETIISCFLLILCGLFTFSVVSAYQLDFGTRLDRLYTGNVSLLPAEYESNDSRLTYIESLKNELNLLPEVENVAFASALPGGWGLGLQVFNYGLNDRELRQEGRYPEADLVMISPDYFSELGVELIQGRGFSRFDDSTSENVVIVDELFAQQYWPSENPIGKLIQLSPGEDEVALTIVGVSQHIVNGQAFGEGLTQPTMYRPLLQNPVRAFGVLVQTKRDQEVSSLNTLFNGAAARVDRSVSIQSIYPLYDHQRLGLSAFDFLGRIMSGFAVFTLLLSVIGIYGIVSRSVLLRAAEVGIRRAVGSSDREVIGIFLQQGLRYLLLGIVIGGGLAMLSSGIMVQMFPDILDGVPLVTATVFLLLGVLILLASYVPARKLVLIEPGDALHYE